MHLNKELTFENRLKETTDCLKYCFISAPLRSHPSDLTATSQSTNTGGKKNLTYFSYILAHVLFRMAQQVMISRLSYANLLHRTRCVKSQLFIHI